MAKKAPFDFALRYRKTNSHRGCGVFDCLDQNQNPSFLAHKTISE